MQAQEHDLDSLQEKASELYLQGEFRQALALWRELLEHAPDNERAREGARLCEVLAEQMEAAETTDIDRPAVAAPAAVPAGLPVDDADPLDIDLSALNLDGDVTPEPVAEPAPPDETARKLPDPARQAEGIDLGDAEETETVAVASAAVGASASAAAASELQQRVGELLAEARQAQQDGDNDQALSLIGRVFILDEENEAAHELHGRLASEPEPDAKADPSEDLLGDLAHVDEVPDLDLDDMPSLDLDGVDATESVEAPAAEAPATEAPATEAPPPAEAGAEELLLDEDELPTDLFLEEDAVIQPVAVEGPPSTGATQKRTLPAKPLLIAAGLIVLAGVGLFGWQQLSGGSSEGNEAPPTEPAAQPESTEPAAQPESTEPAGASTAPVAAVVPTGDLDTVLERARTAFEAGDYTAAVVAYNEVVRREPGNAEAQEQLVVAGERYREHKEILDQWESAIRLFNQGDYRSSLVLLYRLPEDEDPERVARFSRNGWYNMGLQALKAGDCKTARNNFREARTVDSADPGVQQAVELCRACLAGDKSSSYYRTINRLAYRGLDD